VIPNQIDLPLPEDQPINFKIQMNNTKSQSNSITPYGKDDKNNKKKKKKTSFRDLPNKSKSENKLPVSKKFKEDY